MWISAGPETWSAALVRIKWIGSGICFLTVCGTVTIAINICWIGSSVQFFTVVYTITIAVGAVWIGSEISLLIVA